MSFPAFGVIITAAGTSSRFRSSDDSLNKKEFMMLDDRTVLYHAAQPFFSLPGLRVVVVTYGDGMREETESALDNLFFASLVPVLLVQGGQSRQESVLRALEALQEHGDAIEYVMIHDGARPWISERCIISTLAIATVFGGAAPAVPIHDAVKRVDDKGRLIDHLDRTGMVGIQTPQAFRFQAILAAHRQVASSGKVYRDDTEIFTDYGGIVGTSEGEVKNRKITLMQDLTESGVR